MSKSLQELQAEVTAMVKAKGWDDEPVPFPQAIAMLHSEVSEALEAWRLWGTEDGTYHVSADKYVRGIKSPNGGPPKPEGVGSEFADILIRLLDNCRRWNIDLESEFERKMAYNNTRPYRWSKI